MSSMTGPSVGGSIYQETPVETPEATPGATPEAPQRERSRSVMEVSSNLGNTKRRLTF